METAYFFLAPGAVGDPQVLTELSGTTMGCQGKTGQHGSVANFFLAPGMDGNPQVLMELSGTAVGIQMKTRQPRSAANFPLAPGRPEILKCGWRCLTLPWEFRGIPDNV